jgi:hypothetical protein
MPRKYVKSSPYWSIRKEGFQPAADSKPQITPRPFIDIGYGSTQVGIAADSTTQSRSSQTNSGLADPGAFSNISSIGLPWSASGGNSSYLGMKSAIDLCARAWVGVSAVRNAIEVSVEFSDQPLYIKCSNETVKNFFTEWFKAIQLDRLKEEFFREYYRSGNVFLYKFNGKFGPAYFKHYQNTFAAKENRLPIRYVLLNPSNVFVPTGLTYPHSYVRLLSTYELERLRNPMTEQDKQVYESLPADVKSQIRSAGAMPFGIYIPIESERLRFAFYKKQSYEPLAVPMTYPVLPDIEWKLTLKKMDKELARKIEHAILLVTTGEAPNEWNGGNGININNIARLQALLNNPTLGRVLVGDYTTKGEWLIPDVSAILGPEKYSIVNEDIKEGLQSVLVGDDKFANAQIKAKIFIQRLVQGQEAFLNEFLMPEIIQICENMGFRTVPKIGFRKINLQDETVMGRLYNQLGQLGILTADETVEALETGILPDKDEMLEHQMEYKKLRDKGQFLPLVGGTQADDGSGTSGGAGSPGGRPAGSGVKKSVKTVGPIGTSRGAAFSTKEYMSCLRASSNLLTAITERLAARFKVKEMNSAQIGVAESLMRSVMATMPIEKWTDKSVVSAAIENPPLVPTAIATEIDEIAEQYGVDRLDATILRLCKTALPKA